MKGPTVRAAFALLRLLVIAPVAGAQPSVENAMDVVVHPDRVAISARISLPQLDIAHPIEDDGMGPVPAEKLSAAMEAHRPYLLGHLKVSADGTPLVGTVVSVTPPDKQVTWEYFDQHHATYELSYPLPAPPKRVKVEHDLLKEFSRLGQRWDVTFAVRIRQSDQGQFTQSFLSQSQPLVFEPRWPRAVVTAATAPATAPAVASEPVDEPARDTHLNVGQVAWQYTVHGFEHIVTGYDHLLFVAALVLAATTLWDLVKVVTAFAVAHTLTLTLSVLDVVRLPSEVVEPVIAGSIVFVALQNALFPRTSRGAARLAIAFVFGLFHGLGFAGGLLETMEGLPAINLAVSLIAFTLGVELAHQVLIVPLYFVLRFLRRRFGGSDVGEAAPAEVVRPSAPLGMRLASVAISLVGMMYFVASLRHA